MDEKFFQGELVELVPVDTEKDVVLWESWDHDSKFQRLLNFLPAVHISSTQQKEAIESEEMEGAVFSIKIVTEEKTIGFVELDGYDWTSREAWVGIGIGDPEFQGKGYGTEAMQLLLKFAFQGLNLHRVSLNVFDFNKRAIRSYEKAGFRYEGTMREIIFKEDQRWDVQYMGILRSEWQQRQETSCTAIAE